jgi:CheY-like chemotaxis protein
MPKILVVEDEPNIALGLEDDLRLEGYDVEVLGDGAAASRRALECCVRSHSARCHAAWQERFRGLP